MYFVCIFLHHRSLIISNCWPTFTFSRPILTCSCCLSLIWASNNSSKVNNFMQSNSHFKLSSSQVYLSKLFFMVYTFHFTFQQCLILWQIQRSRFSLSAWLVFLRIWGYTKDSFCFPWSIFSSYLKRSFSNYVPSQSVSRVFLNFNWVSIPK